MKQEKQNWKMEQISKLGKNYIRSTSGIMYGAREKDPPLPINNDSPFIIADTTVDQLSSN